MIAQRLRATCFALVCLGAVLACETSAPPAATSPAATTPPGAAAPTAPVVPAAAEAPVALAPPVKLEVVPAREDFEEEAETQISPANLEKQLEALEKEIASE
ncbi:MAG: hypothetical protein ABI895_19535 [Deltaproteobacteria bacterium]